MLYVIGFICWGVVGFLSAFIVGRICAEMNKAPVQLPPETDWILYPQVPAYMGWYYTRHKLEERMKFWTGRVWKYDSNDEYECYFQDCDFKGLTKRVTP
jgi:hypothetical protein